MNFLLYELSFISEETLSEITIDLLFQCEFVALLCLPIVCTVNYLVVSQLTHLRNEDIFSRSRQKVIDYFHLCSL